MEKWRIYMLLNHQFILGENPWRHSKASGEWSRKLIGIGREWALVEVLRIRVGIVSEPGGIGALEHSSLLLLYLSPHQSPQPAPLGVGVRRSPRREVVRPPVVNPIVFSDRGAAPPAHIVAGAQIAPRFGVHDRHEEKECWVRELNWSCEGLCLTCWCNGELGWEDGRSWRIFIWRNWCGFLAVWPCNHV